LLLYYVTSQHRCAGAGENPCRWHGELFRQRHSDPPAQSAHGRVAKLAAQVRPESERSRTFATTERYGYQNREPRPGFHRGVLHRHRRADPRRSVRLVRVDHGRHQPGVATSDRLGRVQPALGRRVRPHAEGSFPTQSGKVEFHSSISWRRSLLSLCHGQSCQPGRCSHAECVAPERCLQGHHRPRRS
jgi:hypothetical protein